MRFAVMFRLPVMATALVLLSSAAMAQEVAVHPDSKGDHGAIVTQPAPVTHHQIETPLGPIADPAAPAAGGEANAGPAPIDSTNDDDHGASHSDESAEKNEHHTGSHDENGEEEE